MMARLLCDSEDLHLKIGEMAAALQVSAKTVWRELPKVENFLAEYGLGLEKKSGSGLWLTGKTKDFVRLQKFFAQTAIAAKYTPEERRRLILSRLLPGDAPVKLFYFSSLLNVTDGTVSNDLDKLEPWLTAHSLRLIRKPGLGIYLEGLEQDFRRATVAYIYETMGEGHLLQLMREKPQDEASSVVSRVAQHFQGLVEEKVLRQLESLVLAVDNKLGHRLSDNALVGLIVHLSLAVQRMRQQDEIKMESSFLDELREHPEFQIASLLAADMATAFNITVPPDEIGYITMHLLGARNRYREKNLATIPVLDNFHLVRLANDIMRRASIAAKRDISGNKNLLAGLVNHLGPSVSRLKMRMAIRNPLLTEMQEHYPELMAISREAVVGIEEMLKTKLPEAEIAYIAMHLGAALADSEDFRRVEHAVAVACPTGMGTSRLLASSLRRHYANIRVVDHISTLQVDDAYVRQQGIEFVISTVPIYNVTVPVVVVSPLLEEADIRRIDLAIKQQNESFLRQAAEAAIALPPFREALQRLQDYGQAILAMLTGFFCRTIAADDVAEVCRQAGRLATTDTTAQEAIGRGLWEREKKASTLLARQSLLLLHCRSASLTAPLVGILRLTKPIILPEDGEEARTALVLLAPEDASPQILETIGCVSATLLERWGFIKLLHEGTAEQVVGELEQIFSEFYRAKHKELLG